MNLTGRARRMKQIAEIVGCEVDVTYTKVGVGGEDFAVVNVRAKDNLHAIELLNALAEDDANHDPDIKRLGAKWRWTSEVRGWTDTQLAAALQDFVRKSVAFVPETGEAFRSAALTLRLGSGDCDDSAHALVAISQAAGLRARCVPVYTSPNAMDPSHVCAQIYAGGAWRWAETTFNANFGEEPISAAKRLGILRSDLGTHGG